MRTFASFLATNRPVHVIGILGLGASMLLAGCGGGMQDTTSSIEPVSNVQGPSFHGNAHGGPNPVVGATVKLYATGSSSPGSSSDGYGVGTFLAEAAQQGTSPGQDTNASGDFIFTATYTCPAKQFAYIVVSGGNPGGGINTSAVLVAAIGRCEDLSSSTLVYVNELTTIAAAYALGHFANVTCGGVTCTSGNITATNVAVGIGAPITANSQKYTDANGHSAGCISNTFYGTTACPQTVTAALYHAFLNANNLMPTTTYSQSAPLYVANAGTTSNPPLVSQRLLNSMGNALVACVNSTGASSTACGIVFGAGTLGGVTPSNTFQAMINIAQNPTLAGTNNPTTSTPYTPTTFLAAASSTTNSYSPTLTGTIPPDLEVTIFYPGDASASSGTSPTMDLGYISATQFGLYDAYSVGVDINDTAYVGVQTGTTGSTGGAIMSFSSSGTLLNNPVDSTTYTQLGFPSPDGLGNLYTCNTNTSTGTTGATATVQQWTMTTAGLVASTPTASIGTGSYSATTACTTLAVDRSGNVWVGNNNTTNAAAGDTYNVYELVPPLTTNTTCTQSSTSGCYGVFNLNNGVGLPTGSSFYPNGITVDPNQNIWMTAYAASTTPSVVVLQNTGTASAPTYGFQTGYTGGGGNSSGTSKVPATAISAPGSGGEQGYALLIACTACTSSTPGYTSWIDTNVTVTPPATSGYGGVEAFTPTLNAAEVTGLTAGTFYGTVVEGTPTSSALNLGVADGLGNLYWADQGGNQMMMTNTQGTTPVNYPLFPCTLYSGGTGCTTTSPSSPRGVSMDSTGTEWVATGTRGLLQVIGLGAPTWPQLSLGKVGRP